MKRKYYNAFTGKWHRLWAFTSRAVMCSFSYRFYSVLDLFGFISVSNERFNLSLKLLGCSFFHIFLVFLSSCFIKNLTKSLFILKTVWVLPAWNSTQILAAFPHWISTLMCCAKNLLAFMGLIPYCFILSFLSVKGKKNLGKLVHVFLWNV